VSLSAEEETALKLQHEHNTLKAELAVLNEKLGVTSSIDDIDEELDMILWQTFLIMRLMVPWRWMPNTVA